MSEARLVLSNLFRRQLRATLMIVSIFVSFVMFGVLASFRNTLDEGSDTRAASRLVTVNAINFTQPLPLAYVEQISASIAADVSHASWFGGFFQDPRNLVSVLAVDPKSYLGIYSNDLEVDDAARQLFLSSRDAVLVGEGPASRMGWKPGDIVPLSSNIYVRADGSKSWQVKIAGIFRSRRPAQTANFVLMNYDYLNETRTFGKDSISWLVVEPRSGADDQVIAAAIDAKFANSDFETSTTTEKLFDDEFASQYQILGKLIIIVVGVAFFTLLLVVASMMALNLRERTREIGVLKTIGFSNARIMRMVLAETILLTEAGAVPAMLAAFAFVHLAGEALSTVVPGLSFTPRIAGQTMALAFVFGLTAGIVPSLAILRMPTGTALGAT